MTFSTYPLNEGSSPLNHAKNAGKHQSALDNLL